MQPSEPLPVVDQLKQLRDAKQHAEGIARATEYLAQGNTPTAEFLFQLGMCYSGNRQWDEAEKYVQAAIDLAPDAPAFSMCLGRIAERKGDFEAALNRYVATNQRFPQDYPTVYALTNVAIKLKRPQLAEEPVRQLLEQSPHTENIHLLNVKLGQYSADTEESQRRLTHALITCPDSIRLANLQFGLAITDKNWGLVDRWGPQALEHSPDNVFVHGYYIKAATELQHWAHVEERLQAAIAACPEELGFARHYAQMALKRGAMHVAEKRFKQGLEKFPNDTQFAAQYAESAAARGDHATAEQRYEQASKKFPDDAIIRSGYAKAALRAGNSAVAHEQITRALKLDDREPRNYSILAAIAVRLDDPAQKQKLLNAALDGFYGKCEPSLLNLEIVHALTYSLRESHPQQFRLRVQQLENALKILEATAQFSAAELAPYYQKPEMVTPEDMSANLYRFVNSNDVFNGAVTHAVDGASARGAWGEGHRMDGTPYYRESSDGAWR